MAGGEEQGQRTGLGARPCAFSSQYTVRNAMTSVERRNGTRHLGVIGMRRSATWRGDLEIWSVAALPLELLQPTDLQLGCFFRLITACSCSSRELVRGSASYVLWQSPGGTRLQRNGTERCCSGALLQRMPSGSSGDRVGKHAMQEIATSSAATIPVAEVLRIAGTNADANELPPD